MVKYENIRKTNCKKDQIIKVSLIAFQAIYTKSLIDKFRIQYYSSGSDLI